MLTISESTLDRAMAKALEGITPIDDDAAKLDAFCPGWDDWGKDLRVHRKSLAAWLWSDVVGTQQATNSQQQSQMAQMAQQKRQMLRSFRKNTRKRYALWNQNISGIGYGGQYSAVAPQVGLATRVWAQFRLNVQDTATTSTLLPRGPYGFITRIQFVTNLGSNNIWDTDGWNCHFNNLTKGDSGNRADVNLDQEYTDLYPSSGATTRYYPFDPLWQYPQLATANTSFVVAFTLRIDLVPNVKKNFTQGMLNLQAPQVQASINISTGQAANLYGSPTAQTMTAGVCNFYYEYFEIPNPLRRVALPSGMLHCTLEQTQAIQASGLQQYTIPRQGILLRLQEEVVLNSLLAKGGTVGTGTNAGTAGVDFFNLQLNNQDTIYTKNYELQKQLQQEEFDLFNSFAGMFLFDFFDAMDEPGSGDMRDCIDTEAVTTTIFGTSVNGSATIGTAFMNLTREILLPFNTQATGVANAA